MNIKVIRKSLRVVCTLGEMYVDGVWFANTLEDPFRNLNGDITKKVEGDTCIDNGTYKVVVSMSNRLHKVLPEILNVPCFTGVRIHGGNTDADTLGCILIGAETDHLGKIWNCALKVAELTEMVQSAGSCDIEIVCETVA